MEQDYYTDHNVASSSAAGSSWARPVDEEKYEDKDEDKDEDKGEAEPPPTAALSEAQKRKRRRVALRATLAEAPSCNAVVTR